MGNSQPQPQRDPAWGLAAVAAGIARAEQGLAMLRETLGDETRVGAIEGLLRVASAHWKRLSEEVGDGSA